MYVVFFIFRGEVRRALPSAVHFRTVVRGYEQAKLVKKVEMKRGRGKRFLFSFQLCGSTSVRPLRRIGSVRFCWRKRQMVMLRMYKVNLEKSRCRIIFASAQAGKVSHRALFLLFCALMRFRVLTSVFSVLTFVFPVVTFVCSSGRTVGAEAFRRRTWGGWTTTKG